MSLVRVPDEANTAYFYDTLIASFHLGLRRPSHRHGAAQLTLSLDGIPHAAGPDSHHLRAGHIHLVGTHQPHAFDGGAGEQLLLWLTPEARITRELGREHLDQSGYAVLPATLLEALPLDELRHAHRERWSGARMRPLVEATLHTLSRSTPAPPRPMHPAVRRAVRIIHALPIKKISADALAARVGLSKSRLLHLLKEHLGIPLRPYLAWLRSLDGIVRMAEGLDATQAALSAGFTDGAHFNRVMRRNLCLSPSSLVAHTRVEVCLLEA